MGWSWRAVWILKLLDGIYFDFDVEEDAADMGEKALLDRMLEPTNVIRQKECIVA